MRPYSWPRWRWRLGFRCPAAGEQPRRRHRANHRELIDIAPSTRCDARRRSVVFRVDRAGVSKVYVATHQSTPRGVRDAGGQLARVLGARAARCMIARTAISGACRSTAARRLPSGRRLRLNQGIVPCRQDTRRVRARVERKRRRRIRALRPLRDLRSSRARRGTRA